jgi:YVTN family beta-propeller protein
MNMFSLFGTLSCLVATPWAMAQQVPEPISPQVYQRGPTWILGGDGGWDLLTIDSVAHRLYIARATRTMVINADSGALIGEIPGNGVHGIAVSPATNRGFVTNGKDNTVTIFDLKTLAVLGSIPVGTKPDAIALDPSTGLVFVCNNGGTTLSILEPLSGTVKATLEVAGNPELVAVDGQGHLFTNLEDTDEVAEIDTRSLKLIAHWPLAPGKGPSGVAVDVVHHRLFSACHDSHTLEVLATDSGQVVASLPIGAGTDGAVFDPASDNIFCPNGDGTLTIIHEQDPMTFTVLQTLATQAGARTIALDTQTHRLFTVTAQRQPVVPGEVLPTGRPKYLPGTFSVLTIDPKK